VKINSWFLVCKNIINPKIRTLATSTRWIRVKVLKKDLGVIGDVFFSIIYESFIKDTHSGV
jgi:hypothetical protein